MIDHLNTQTFANVVLGSIDEAARIHLQGCHSCAQAVEEARSFSESEPLPLLLHQEAERVRKEDEEAKSQLTDRDLDPEHFDSERFDDPSLMTAGVVRRLLKHSNATCPSNPKFALELTVIAQQVVDKIVSSDEASRSPLRADALREQANALRYMGKYDEAMQALDAASASLQSVSASSFDEARIDFTRASMLFKKHRFEEAQVVVERCRQVFEDHGDIRGIGDTWSLIGGIAGLQGRPLEARTCFEEMLRAAESIDDPYRIALAQNNLGAMEQDLGNLTNASERFRKALDLFDFLKLPLERARTEWSLGLLSLSLGHESDGFARLKKASENFQITGSPADAALVVIDIIEHLLQRQRFAEAKQALTSFDVSALPEHGRSAIAVLSRQLRDANSNLLEDTRVQLRLAD